MEHAPLTTRQIGIGCLAVVAGIAALLFLAFKVCERQFERDRIPSRLEVSKTPFQVEESWGIGPGGNETGLVVYELENGVSRRLIEERKSLNSDATIRASFGDSDRGYFEWKRTPVDIKDRPRTRIERPPYLEKGSLIEPFLTQYGYSIEVDRPLIREIDEILNTSGAYYAYGRGSAFIVVAPQQRRLIFAYAG